MGMFPLRQSTLWEPWKSSGIKSADATIKSIGGIVGQVIVCDDGTVDLEVEIKDDTTVKIRVELDISIDGKGPIIYNAPSPGILFETDIKLDVTGGNAPEVIVIYK